MSKIHCNVIQDLLPLYADDVVSEESRNLIAQHLEYCPDCRQMLSEIQTSIPIPQHTDDTALKKIKKKQRARGMRITLLVVLCVVLLLAYPVSLIYSNSIDGLSAEYGPEHFIVTEYPGGQVELTLMEDAQGAYIYYLYEINEDDSTDLYLYIYGKDPVPQWMRRFFSLGLFSESVYPVCPIGPQYNFENNDYFPSYDGVSGLKLDATISEVYYQTITAQEQALFYREYLRAGYLIGYDAPEKADCTRIWGRGK